MKRILKFYLPGGAIVFMLTIVCSALSNCIQGYEAMGNKGILQVFGFVVLAEIVLYLLEKVDFKSYKMFFLTETGILYVLLLICSYLGNWFTFHVGRILWVTIVYLGISVYMHYYFYRINKMKADELNEMLDDK